MTGRILFDLYRERKIGSILSDQKKKKLSSCKWWSMDSHTHTLSFSPSLPLSLEHTDTHYLSILSLCGSYSYVQTLSNTYIFYLFAMSLSPPFTHTHTHFFISTWKICSDNFVLHWKQIEKWEINQTSEWMGKHSIEYSYLLGKRQKKPLKSVQCNTLFFLLLD